MMLSYQEGSSWRAFEAVDRCYAGGRHDVAVTEEMGMGVDDPTVNVRDYTFDLTFGCQTSITGLFKTQLADGILGMSDKVGSFWKQMYDQGTIEKRLFSMCFNFQPDVTKEGTLAGAMSLGGVDERLWKTPVVYASRINSSGFYGVGVRAVYLWEGSEGALTGIAGVTKIDQHIVKLGVDEKAMMSVSSIVDSGTTDTYMNTLMEKAFKKAWQEMVGSEYTNSGRSMTYEEIIKFPTVIIQLQGDSSDTSDNTIGLAGSLDPQNPNDVKRSFYALFSGMCRGRFFFCFLAMMDQKDGKV